MDEDAEFYRWYGPWMPQAPPDMANLFAGMPARWWVFGGWAIEAFTGRSREHEDVDVGVLRADLPALLDHVLPTHCVWSNLSGTLRPLRTPDELPDGCRQLWVRKDGASPWLFDVGLNPHDGDSWICVRDNTIRLPMERAPVPPKPARRAPVLAKRAYRILVIEDNRDAAKSMKKLLELVGHRVETAFSGAAGVEAARAFHPQVVLCDIGLPGGMDGYAVARALRQEASLASAHLIALTGYAQEEDQRCAREAGFNRHMTKPVDFPELQAVLASLPERSSADGACE